MSEQDSSTQKALQPLTFRGLARFAGAKLTRLFVIQFLFSLVLFASVVWFANRNYAPVIVSVIRQLPETGELKNGKLTGIDDRLEGEGKFLSLVADSIDISDTGTGDVQVGLGETNFVVCSFLSSSWGCLSFSYPNESVDLSRSFIQPWWGARQPFLIAAFGGIVVLATMIGLGLIALVLMWLARYVAYFADRRLTNLEAWKYSVASQFPGLVVLAAAVFLYGVQAMDLLGLGVFYVLHIIVDLVYLVGAIAFLPRIDGVITSNPFIPGNR
jgi:hypothetical protein